MKLHLRMSAWPIFFLLALGAAAAGAATVSHLEVRIVTGATELSAGSSLELRIYEPGKNVRRLPLVHGEAWPRDSTHIIPVKLNDALDPRNVVRFSLYYRSSSLSAPGLDIVSADVELPSQKGQPELLLSATLSGMIAREGELATQERDQAALTCRTDADCDDKRTCNGKERCAPRAGDADARGCVRGTPAVCPVNQVCVEGAGCRGIQGTAKPDESAPKPDAPKPDAPKPDAP